MTAATHAPAKLNLFLNVVGRREDGYHLIDSLFAFVGLADGLRIAPSDRPSVAAEGPFAAALGAEADNLVARAQALMIADAGGGRAFAITIEKRIPVAAGLGGGSADAAATIRALDAALGSNLPRERLAALAASLGADVPACLEGRPVVARGIGEILVPAPAMPACGVLLANPRVPTPTPAVFQAFRALNPSITPREPLPLPVAIPDLAALVEAIAPRGNDLLPAALTVTPVIGEVVRTLEALPGAAYAGLSGSGATCFALFEREEQARSAAGALSAERGWWTWAGGWAAP